MKKFLRRNAIIFVTTFLVIIVLILGDTLKDGVQVLAVGLLVIVFDRMYSKRLGHASVGQKEQLTKVSSYLRRMERARVRDANCLQEQLIRITSDLERNHSAILLGIANQEALRAKAAGLELESINGMHASISGLIGDFDDFAAESMKNHSAIMLGIRNHEASRAKAAKLEIERINRMYSNVTTLLRSFEEFASAENRVPIQLMRLYSEVNAQLIESSVALDSIHHRIENLQNR